ncbi:hypothetical protein BDR05DRAFT_993547 [Suillus weaverae]|nr:hypothetical protein BDR05DRAFT_993547 [Suillus weaverae]
MAWKCGRTRANSKLHQFQIAGLQKLLRTSQLYNFLDSPCFEPKLKQSNLWERLWICIGTFDTGTMCWLWTTQSLSKDLEQQISLLRKSRWVDLSELVDFAMKPLLKPTCQSIQLLGNGSYNTVYKLVFANGTEITASVPVHDMDP